MEERIIYATRGSLEEEQITNVMDKQKLRHTVLDFKYFLIVKDSYLSEFGMHLESLICNTYKCPKSVDCQYSRVTLHLHFLNGTKYFRDFLHIHNQTVANWQSQTTFYIPWQNKFKTGRIHNAQSLNILSNIHLECFLILEATSFQRP